MTPVASLSELLCELFTTAELHRWLASREATAALDRSVDLSGPPVEVCFRVVTALERRQLLDASFFADLGAARPARTAEIRAEAARWVRADAIAAAEPAPAPASAAAGPVRILHLSDLHAQKKTEWDSRVLLTRLVDAVGELVAAGLAPDVVALTGDLAFGGAAREYALVERWLREELLPTAKLDTNALLIVPGNHDVDRGATTSVAVGALDDRLRGGDPALLAEVLGDASQRRLIHGRYKHYLAFLKRLGVSHPHTPSWSWTTTIHDLKIRFAGLDTAWLHTRDDLKGRLVLGLAPLNAVLPARRDADLVVALAHHPTSWLTERDQRAVEAPLRARADLLLRGHLHDPDYTLTQTPHQRFVELPAGASYAVDAWPMSFQLVDLDPARKEGRVHLRTWSPVWDAWVPDRTRLPTDGNWRFDLR